MRHLAGDWSIRFARHLYAWSYAELVAALLEVTEGRIRPCSPFEVEVTGELAVCVRASPHLRVPPDADRATRELVLRLDARLIERNRVITRVAQAITWAQAAYFNGEATAPRALDAEVLVIAAGVERDVFAACLRNKLVAHPRGLSTLEELVTPGRGPSALTVLVRRPTGPTSPALSAAAQLSPRIG